MAYVAVTRATGENRYDCVLVAERGESGVAARSIGRSTRGGRAQWQRGTARTQAGLRTVGQLVPGVLEDMFPHEQRLGQQLHLARGRLGEAERVVQHRVHVLRGRLDRVQLLQQLGFRLGPQRLRGVVGLEQLDDVVDAGDDAAERVLHLVRERGGRGLLGLGPTAVLLGLARLVQKHHPLGAQVLRVDGRATQASGGQDEGRADRARCRAAVVVLNGAEC